MPVMKAPGFRFRTLALGCLLALGCAPATQGAAAAGAAEPAADLLRVGFLVVDGVYGTELVAPHDVFTHAALHTNGTRIEVSTVSPDGAPVTTAEGLELVPDHGFATAPPYDLLVVPSAEHSRDSDRQDARLVEWIAATGGRARHVVSFCWGAYLLAEAGPLDGLAATTFPDDVAVLAAAFPEIDVRLNVSFVHDGKALTSQGGARSYEAALYLVERLFGDEVAGKVAHGLLVPWPLPAEVEFIAQ